MFQFDISAARGVRCLLQEDSVAGNFRNVNGNAETLAGEDGVHDGYVLVGKVATYGENEDAREKGRWWGGV